ncbi:transposase [Azospirillum argentinense]|uniref:Transposase n=2 Tax=Azospirillum argentinense TaxID=2970906 RepID=A0A4D8P6X6_9PROT|nr:transposase [Azospirillum argentinense]
MAATGTLEPVRQGRPPGGGKLAPHADFLIGWVEKQGDITMPELTAKLNAKRGVTVHPASLSRFLLARGYSVKKRCWRPRPVALTLLRTAGLGAATV